MGSPSKIHDIAIRNRILESLAEGNYIEVATASAGITARTLRNWRKSGELAHRKRDEGRDLTPTEEVFALFLDALGEHRALGEEKLVRRIVTASRTDWKAAAWILERAFPKRWAKREIPPDPIDYDKIAEELERALHKG